ncbi:hypothetical protein IKS57_04710 [bacterium]|nr:hypothetical protein [bacterium]
MIAITSGDKNNFILILSGIGLCASFASNMILIITIYEMINVITINIGYKNIEI